VKTREQSMRSVQKGHVTWDNGQVDFSVKRLAYLLHSHKISKTKPVVKNFQSIKGTAHKFIEEFSLLDGRLLGIQSHDCMKVIHL
jgi:hypothetical protein